MKIRPEEIDGRIADCLEAWRTARQHCAAIADEAARPAAERIADRLRDEGIQDCLAPLFKAAVKGKKSKKK
ncbi:MAG: hypothetical protein ACXVDD_04690 [Polyangia bacterium]|jgi:hypothetical protein